MIASYEFERVCVLLLHPSQTSLPGCSQVIAVGEVKAIFKVLLDVVDHLLGLFLFALLFH